MPRAVFRYSSTISISATLLAVAIFASCGVGAFGQVSESDQDAPSNTIVSCDFNRDGIADVAEASFAPGDPKGHAVLTISLGRADGTFQKIASKIILGQKPQSLVVGDFNRDGFCDVIVGDADGFLSLFLGDGTGDFTAAGEIGRFSSVVSMVAVDFNHDGILDLAISDPIASSVIVLLGAGNGSFLQDSSCPFRRAGTSPHLAAADFDGDGIPDLAVVYKSDDGDTYDVLLGNGKGQFAHAPNLSVVPDPNAHCPT